MASRRHTQCDRYNCEWKRRPECYFWKQRCVAVDHHGKQQDKLKSVIKTQETMIKTLKQSHEHEAAHWLTTVDNLKSTVASLEARLKIANTQAEAYRVQLTKSSQPPNKKQKMSTRSKHTKK